MDGNIELAREVVLMNCKPITNADGIEEQDGPISVKEDYEAEVPDNFRQHAIAISKLYGGLLSPG